MREESLRQLIQLRDELHAWQKQVGAKHSTPNANYDPDKPSGRSAARAPAGEAAPKGKKKK